MYIDTGTGEHTGNADKKTKTSRVGVMSLTGVVRSKSGARGMSARKMRDWRNGWGKPNKVGFRRGRRSSCAGR